MITELKNYLRDIALTSARLACACPHAPTSHGLAEVAMDLMAKARDLEEVDSETSACAGAHSSRSAKIFIVDDDELVRDSMETLIRALGHDTETFISAEDCLSRGQIAEASCVITDVQMPGMSGFELHKRLQANGYRVPVIFMSGRPGKAPCEAGAIGFLAKPFRVHHLIDYLDKALKFGSSMRKCSQP